MNMNLDEQTRLDELEKQALYKQPKKLANNFAKAEAIRDVKRLAVKILLAKDEFQRASSKDIPEKLAGEIDSIIADVQEDLDVVKLGKKPLSEIGEISSTLKLAIGLDKIYADKDMGIVAAEEMIDQSERSLEKQLAQHLGKKLKLDLSSEELVQIRAELDATYQLILVKVLDEKIQTIKSATELPDFIDMDQRELNAELNKYFFDPIKHIDIELKRMEALPDLAIFFDRSIKPRVARLWDQVKACQKKIQSFHSGTEQPYKQEVEKTEQKLISARKQILKLIKKIHHIYQLYYLLQSTEEEIRDYLIMELDTKSTIGKLQVATQKKRGESKAVLSIKQNCWEKSCSLERRCLEVDQKIKHALRDLLAGKPDKHLPKILEEATDELTRIHQEARTARQKLQQQTRRHAPTKKRTNF